MSLRKIALLGGISLLALTQGAAAQTTGPYLGLGLGANFRQDADLALQGDMRGAVRRLGMDGTGRLGFDNPGVTALGSLGWGFGNGLRAEVEFSYRRNDAGSLSVSGVPAQAAASGHGDTYAVMANALYDITQARRYLGGVGTPYVGFGLGYGWSNYHRIMVQAGTQGAATYGSDGGFAWQAIAGLAWDLSRLLPGLSLTTEYRYVSLADQSVSLGARVGRMMMRELPVEASNHNHALLLGLRYAFRGP